MQTKLQAPPEPRLDDWCTSARMEQLCQELRPAKDALLWSGQLETVVKGWVRRQLVDEVLQSGVFTPSPEESAQEEPSHARLHGPSPRIRPGSSRIKPCSPGQSSSGAMVWSRCTRRERQGWTGPLRMLRVSDMAFSLELYHRIKAGEASFEQLSWRFGEGPERLKGGEIKNQRLDALPAALFPLLVNLHSVDVQKPRAIGKMYVLLQLLDRQPCVFDQDTRRQLLMEQLQCWEAPLVQRLGAHLTSSD